MESKILSLFFLLLMSSLVISSSDAQDVTNKPKTTHESCSTAESKLIRQAGERLRVPVRTEQMVHFAQGDASWWVAPAVSLESSQPTELLGGIDIGVGYFALPGQKFPKGFYKIRAFADAKQVGQVKGRVQIVNEKGEITTELPATVEVRSMAVARVSKPQSTMVSICTGAACNIGGIVESAVGSDYGHCTWSFWGTICYGIKGENVAILSLDHQSLPKRGL